MRWQDELLQNINTAEEVNAFFAGCGSFDLSESVTGQYPMSITRYYLSLVDPDNPDDPIGRMCLPSAQELGTGGIDDTSGEFDNTVMTGLQHKYGQTVIVLSTNVCSMYCRYCFRKRMVGLNEEEIADNLPAITSYVRSHPEITNVLISGGDSFLNSTDTIRRYLEAFTDIPHIGYIRFGTKVPVVFPNRILNDPELQQVLETYNQKKQIYIVTQFNHPNELTPAAREGVRCLQKLGLVVRNQSVLLGGVNDDPKTLAALFNGLASWGIVPYYLFQCRPTRGANYFQVPVRRGADIVRQANALLSGQSKCFRYAMSSKLGKLEILGNLPDGSTLFKFHQAKDSINNGRIFSRRLSDTDSWVEYEGE